MTLEKGSLILIDYTAKVKDTNLTFETTREEEAKKSELYDPARRYEPRLISVGEGWVLKGLDEALTNASMGDKLNIEITPDKGFGDRDPNKVRMIPLRKLGEKADEVRIGDTIELGERTGIVKLIGSGRVQVDFNHRLAGRTLIYDVEVTKKLKDDNEKVLSLIKRRLPIDDQKIKFSIEAASVQIDLPEETFIVDGLQIIKRAISNDIFKFVPGINNVRFIETYTSQQPSSPMKPEEQKDQSLEKSTEAAQSQ
ncbi:MAG TPA: FKBP-type peptidyl-prolyl cis-trans isomerase [Nitrososphaeraceae archaeon]|jgi:peptidylprolyl isomerase|nr:FKBP-type peptidyl-prolyl cis-trans isomerase [Nitrososphaeraceae archaeon]